MKNITNILILLVLFSLTGCAMLEHRDFEAEMDPFRMDDPMFLPNRDFAVVPGDDGRYYRNETEIRGRTPATRRMLEKERFDNSLKREVVSLENKLDDAGYQEYLKIRNKLGSDSEKIYYLGLTPREKREYLSIRKIQAPKYYTVRESQMATYQKEVVMGMGKTDVLRSWGEPDRKDYSGDPRYQNERWAYSRNGRTKYIYFEGGLVGGWTEQ